MRTPLVPELAATLKLVQFKVDALNGAVGPRPLLIGLNATPVPAGMAKQLLHSVPPVADVPKPQVADCAAAPGEMVPGMDDTSA